jgi:hypothetical protein
VSPTAQALPVPAIVTPWSELVARAPFGWDDLPGGAVKVPPGPYAVQTAQTSWADAAFTENR